LIEYEKHLDHSLNVTTDLNKNSSFSHYQDKVQEDPIPQEKSNILKNIHDLNFKVAGNYMSLLIKFFFDDI